MARKTYYLDEAFGLNYTKSQTQIGTDMTLAEAKTLFPKFYQRMTTKGPMFLGRPLTDAEFLKLYWFDVCWGEALWQGQGGGQPIETGYLSSQNHVVVPAGTYRHAIPAEFSAGEYEMDGTGYTDVNNDSVNTKLEVGHENWLGNPAQRHSLISGSWGVTGNMGYVEGTQFHRFRINGRQDATAAIIAEKFESNGLMHHKPGEVTDSGRIWAENYRTRGFVLYQPTPHNLGNLSAFQCVVSGVGFLGAWGGTTNLALLSSDACGAMFDFIPMNGEAGGCLNIGAIKNETMVASSGRSWRGQCVGYLRGQFLVNIGVVSGAVGGGTLPALFVIDDRLVNGTPQGSYLEFRVKGFNYDSVVHDVRRGHMYKSPGNYQAAKYEYSTADGTMISKGAKVTPVTGQATFRINHVVGSGPLNTGPTATPYREIIVAPPAFPSTVYLDAAVTPPPVTCTWVTGAWGAWSACANGTQTRTRTVTSSVAGCTPTDPKPAETESQACGTTPPPVTGGIDPADVVVVINSDDPASAAMAAAYKAAWGVTATVTVSLGGDHDCENAGQVTTARTAIYATGKQFMALAMSFPSRHGGQSITSALTYGPRNVTLLTTSALYGYTGFKPKTDKGVMPSWLLLSSNYIRKDAHGTKPAGQAISLLANDSTGTPRGSARAAQRPTGVRIIDSRNNPNIGKGENFCNAISNDCYVAANKPGTTPIVAGYQSNYILLSPGNAVWAKGFYGDHVTSVGGYLPGGTAPKYQNSQGQTALTYHLDKGAALSVGTVVEPWQDKSGNSPGSLVEQFVDITKFHPLFIGGTPIGVAAWSAVKCPDRALFAGDGMTAPFK